MPARRQATIALQLFNRGVRRVYWRLPDSEIERIHDVEWYIQIAKAAEAAKVQALFQADNVGVARGMNAIDGLDPLTMTSAVATHTNNIGLVTTASTTFNQPYPLARSLASLDHISRGRAGWNAVVSANGQETIGIELPSHAERYERAGHFLDAVRALWDSWDPGALVIDRKRGVYTDPEHQHDAQISNEYFTTSAPLNIPPSPQQGAVIFQAGSSVAGKDLAARHAEGVFTAQPTLESSRDFYDDLKSRTAAHGRDPEDLKILAGVFPLLGETLDDARRIHRDLQEFTDTNDFDEQRKHLEEYGLGGIDLSGIDPDEPLDIELLAEAVLTEGRRSRYEVYRRIIAEERPTLRELVRRHNAPGSGHWAPVTTVDLLVEHMIERLDAGVTDGFVVGISRAKDRELFLEGVLPELRRRGYFHDDYEGDTLRANLGTRPGHSVPAERNVGERTR